MSTTEMQRSEYGSVQSSQQQQSGPLSILECQQIVDDILDGVTNPTSPHYNAALATEIQIWNELKNRQSDTVANAIVDMVRAGDKPLHRFFPPSVQVFIGRVDLGTRQQLHRGGDGGGYNRGSGGGGGGGGSAQSRYRE